MKSTNFFKLLVTKGPALVIAAAILWAFDGILRRNLYSLPPIIIVFYEHLLGSFLLLPFVYKALLTIKLTRKEVGIILLVSLLSGVLGTLWFTTALLKVNFIPFSVVFLLQKLQPIFAVTTAIIFLKETVSRKYLAWAALAFIAAYFVTFENGQINWATGRGTIEAAIYALGAALAWGSSTTFSRMALLNKPSQVVTGLRFIFTTFLAIPFIFYFGNGSHLFAPSLSQVLQLILIAVSTGMVALLIYYKGLKHTPVRVATILELVFPVLAITIDAVAYKTFLGPAQLLAAAVLLFSIWKLSALQLNHEV